MGFFKTVEADVQVEAKKLFALVEADLVPLIENAIEAKLNAMLPGLGQELAKALAPPITAVAPSAAPAITVSAAVAAKPVPAK